LLIQTIVAEESRFFNKGGKDKVGGDNITEGGGGAAL